MPRFTGTPVEEATQQMAPQKPRFAGTPAGPRDAATVQAEYDAMPWYAQAGQAADDVVRLIANGATFGYADKLAGYMSGEGTEAERQRSQEARDRAGSAGTAAEIGGAVATPVGLGKAGLTLAGRLGTGAMTGLGGVAARSGLMAAEGAGYGALTAAGNDKDISDGALLGAIFGAGGNAAAEGLTNGLGWIAGQATRPVAPTRPQLDAAREAAYQTAEQAGVAYTPQAVGALRSRVVQELTDMGYDPALQPGAAAVLRRLDELAGQNVTLKGLDTLRKVANNGYAPGNKSNDRALGLITAAIDDLVNNPAAGDVLTGNAGAGAAALTEARDLARRGIKADEIDAAVVRAGRRAASTGKGGNIDNATRQNIRAILDRPGGPRGYTPDEIAAMEKVVYGTPTQNLMRWAGSFAPTGAVSTGAGGGLGYLVGNSLGGPGAGVAGAATLMGVGQMAKMTADSMTRGNVDDLVNLIMSGQAQQPNAVQNALTANKDNLARLFMQAGNVQANQ